MIVDTMSLLEVAAELQSDLKNEVSVKMKRILADRKYWRAVLKYGNSKKTIYFNPLEMRTKRLNRFVVLPFSHGKKDFKKFGIAFTVISIFYYNKYPYVAWFVNDLNEVAFFKKHFFDRYDERFLQSETLFSEDLVLNFFKGNMHVFTGPQYEDRSNNVMGVSNDGILLGEKLSPLITQYNTYISVDMLKGEQIEKHRLLSDNLDDYIKELKEIGMAA